MDRATIQRRRKNEMVSGRVAALRPGRINSSGHNRQYQTPNNEPLSVRHRRECITADTRKEKMKNKSPLRRELQRLRRGSGTNQLSADVSSVKMACPPSESQISKNAADGLSGVALGVDPPNVAPAKLNASSLPPPSGENITPTGVTDLIQPSTFFDWESDEAREMHSKAVRAVLHFSNISNASSDDIVFLYQVQTHVFKISLRRA